MPTNDLMQHIEKLIPGTIGSLGALLWIKTTWPRKIAMLLLGIASSHYVGPLVSTKLGMDPNISAFLIGLFGMSIADGVFRAWETLSLGEILRDAIRHRLGLPK